MTKDGEGLREQMNEDYNCEIYLYLNAFHNFRVNPPCQSQPLAVWKFGEILERVSLSCVRCYVDIYLLSRCDVDIYYLDI